MYNPGLPVAPLWMMSADDTSNLNFSQQLHVPSTSQGISQNSPPKRPRAPRKGSTPSVDTRLRRSPRLNVPKDGFKHSQLTLRTKPRGRAARGASTHNPTSSQGSSSAIHGVSSTNIPQLLNSNPELVANCDVSLLQKIGTGWCAVSLAEVTIAKLQADAPLEQREPSLSDQDI